MIVKYILTIPRTLTFVRMVFVSVLFCASLSHAANITFSVDTSDSSNDVTEDINVSRLLPFSDSNTWVYNLSQSSFAVPRTITAQLGAAEAVGGGCLEVRPLSLGDDLTLYLGNDGESISLYGISIARWKGLRDVLLRFETRNRVEWLDFQNRYISDAITPIDENTCQDTGRGNAERGGVVLLENLTENLGVSGSERGEVDCRGKNSDLRDTFAGGRTGSGTAIIDGKFNPLPTWTSGLTLTRDAANNTVRIQLVFKPTIPIIEAEGVDFTMHLDILLTENVGITSLELTDDGLAIDDIEDLSYALVDSETQIGSTTNEIVASGECPDDGRLSYLMVLLLLGFIPLKTHSSKHSLL